MEELRGTRILVIGLGGSGRSAARFCARHGALVTANDARRADAFGDGSERGEIDALAADGVELALGCAPPDPAGFDLVVPSPGVPAERYAARASHVWGDVELAGRALQVPIVAVTGTNGKSTTVCLIEAMLRAAGLRARAAGNLGTPALELVGEALDVAILEVSSFQLESTEAFRPHVAVVLNISPNHLDRHGDFAAYVAAKQRVLANQREDDWAVLGFDDPVVRKLAAHAKARVMPFAMHAAIDRGVRADAAGLVLCDDKTNRTFALDDFALHGPHNRANAAAALAAVHALGVDLDAAARGFADFRGLPHRCELVVEKRGVRYVDDSKATNPEAAARAIEQSARVWWIAGGRNKGLDFAPLAEAARGRVQRALLIGEAAADIAAALGDAAPSEDVGHLAAAVSRAAALAQPGDTVLLSPACASFDQYSSFEARGAHFAELARALAGAR